MCNKIKYIAIVILVVYFSLIVNAQKGDFGRTIRFMFYNVENYFDVYPDSLTGFHDFTPDGNLHWSLSKYYAKRNSIYKTIIATGKGNVPEIIGLCEIENRQVLDDLINNTPLSRYNLGIAHFESGDHRGIDVALLYKKNIVNVIYAEPINIKSDKYPELKTRDILYVKSLVCDDTVHIFINHWTSRYRGFMESEPLRMLAAETLIQKTDSICQAAPGANIVIMGDFNDTSDNASISFLCQDSQCPLTVVLPEADNQNVKGTLKYKGQWMIFDQIILSESLFLQNTRISFSGKTKIMDAGFLLEKDNKHSGFKPYRTNIGYKYNGGISDHLPIYFDLIFDEK